MKNSTCFKEHRSHLIILLLFLFATGASVAQTNNYSTDLFPTPEVLKPNVEFWKNIYAKYSESEVVIHDSRELNIVYEVVNLKTLFKGINVSARLQWKKINRIKKGYVSILLKLSKRKNLKVNNLKGKEKLVASLFGDNLNPKRLRRAAKDIRAQSGLKERFKLGLERSGLYLDKMYEIFQEAGLPLELLVLPHVESSFNYKAYSKFGAAGIWQFTRSTGRRFMKINYSVDERLDPIRATECSAKLLKINYNSLRSWPLAITAYNHGLAGMKRAKKRHGNNLGQIVQRYRSRSFGFASRNFYAEFLAALQITRNYKYYFGDIEFYKPLEYLSFKTPDYITYKTLIKHLEISPKVFVQFNPALRSPVLKSQRRIPRNFTIRIPYRKDLDLKKLYAQISPEYKFNDQVRSDWHKVRSGEHLSNIARKYRVSLREIMAMNKIRNPHLIYVGQNLQIPSSDKPQLGSFYVATKKTDASKQLAEVTDLKKKEQPSILDVPQTIQLESRTDDTKYTEAREIATGDSETNLDETIKQNIPSRVVKEKRAKPDIESIEKDMLLALPNYYVEVTKNMDARFVQIPQEQIEQEPFRELKFPENGQVIIEPDETLGHLSDWLSVSTQKLRNTNGLSFGQSIQIGQPLWLTFEKVTPEEFHRRRMEYHQGIEEDFYRNYSVEGSKIYKIKKGESIWIICNNIYEIPYWLVKKYNPQKDLMKLMANREIVIPIVEANSPTGLMNDALE